ncbi:hypothetical protein Btru_072328 [Bulinus truncatus]|nr:hypothetical protein Btru_072328 [Bulinus truncatus]
MYYLKNTEDWTGPMYPGYTGEIYLLLLLTTKMSIFACTVIVTLLCGLGMVFTEDEFCYRGFQIAAKFHECWESATYANKYPELYEQHERYTPEFLQGYATHMCSIVTGRRKLGVVYFVQLFIFCQPGGSIRLTSVLVFMVVGGHVLTGRNSPGVTTAS